MKEQLKNSFILARNRWGPSNSIKKSSESTVQMLGNMNRTTIDVSGDATFHIAEGCRIRNSSFTIKGKNNRLEFESGVVFAGKVELFGDGNTFIIGKNTRINGANFTIHNGTKVEIGAGSLFSTYIDVRTTDSHTIMNEAGERINPDQDIFIGEHVWIGRMVSILKGAHIGSGSVIGSMSVVSRTIPERVVAAGVPAKVIKESISWK